MASFLEVRTAGGVRLFPLETSKVTVGRSPEADVSLEDDTKVSWLHAQLEEVADGWSLIDLSSTNGTYVNGKRVSSSQPIFDGDELTIGSTDLVLRCVGRRQSPTEGAERPPDLTPREREVLLALFPAATTGEFFVEPSSTRDMAATLAVSEAAVKQHLLRLYDKFGIHGEGDRRRVRLANEALRRRAVTMADIRRPR